MFRYRACRVLEKKLVTMSSTFRIFSSSQKALILWLWPAVFFSFVWRTTRNNSDEADLTDEAEYEDSRLDNLERGHTRKSLEQAEQVKYFMECYQGTRPVSWLNERTNAAWCMLGYLIKAFLFLFFFLVTTDIERKMSNKRMFPNSFAIWNWFYEVEILLSY